MAHDQVVRTQGQAGVLLFLPQDDTPGCTKEACAFRDRKSEIEALGAVVLGVSADDVASHKKFTDKYELNFRCWPMSITPSPKSTARGARRTCTAKCRWEFSDPHF